MYAVIRTGGKQYRVQKGDVLRLEKLDAGVGKKLSFDTVLLAGMGEDVKVGAEAAKIKVNAIVEAHGRGKKVVVFKKRRRKNYQRTLGHRQDYTWVRVTGISTPRTKAAGEAEGE